MISTAEKNGSEPLGSVLVVGGGIAGIQASLDLSASGYKVYLVERASALGGHMAMLYPPFHFDPFAQAFFANGRSGGRADFPVSYRKSIFLAWLKNLG